MGHQRDGERSSAHRFGFYDINGLFVDVDFQYRFNHDDASGCHGGGKANRFRRFFKW